MVMMAITTNSSINVKTVFFILDTPSCLFYYIKYFLFTYRTYLKNLYTEPILLKLALGKKEIYSSSLSQTINLQKLVYIVPDFSSKTNSQFIVFYVLFKPYPIFY